MSFPIILTLVIMMRTASDHFANDPLSAQEEKVAYSIRHFTKHFLTFTISSKLAHWLVRKIE
jgi:hypothetical protein